MSSIDFSTLTNAKAEYQPIPCWFVATTFTWGLVAWSDSIKEEVDIVGYNTVDLEGLEYEDLPDAPLLVWEGTCKAVAIGSYDGPDGGPEYEFQFTGTWRELTAEEAVALAAGSFEPGVGTEVYNQGSFGRHIMGQLKAIIEAHGPVTHENQGSAHKRMLGSIRDWNNRHRAKNKG